MTTMHELYEAAKAASIGATIICPYCGKSHTKTTYHKVFCNNQKTKKGHSCKDNFWNVCAEDRKHRKVNLTKGTIAPTPVAKIKTEKRVLDLS